MPLPGDRRQVAGHSLADHELGLDYAHVHDGEADHDHDYFDVDGPLEENPLWIQDHVTLVSVGIDIGSSGTQVIFSKINLRRLGEDLSSRYYVVSRETLFQSAVLLTPYQSEERIDDARLGAIIDEAYAAANMHPDDIDTGVVILTGEALRRENAQGIAGILAEGGGEFVCATAGHHMEAMLAAYGSGAARVSHDEGKRVLNVDIGGGTTKLALVEGGRVLATAAVHIGGRLQVVNEEGRDRAARSGRPIPRRAGRFRLAQGRGRQPRGDGQASRTRWPTPWSRRSPRSLCRTMSSISTSPIRSPISAASTASCSQAASPNTSTDARAAISATWAGASAAPCAAGSMPAPCPGRCCRPANASARPRSAPRNTPCS